MKLRWSIAALVCLGAAIWMLVILKDNVVLFEPVSKAVAERPHQGDRAFKMSGAVVPGSIQKNGKDVRFSLTEGGAIAAVRFSGSPPDLFSDCAPVVVQGAWSGRTFVSDQLLIKHDNKYKPPKGKMGEKCPSEPAGVKR
jgi:cytochrome c-type biogenesis protein CcmE